MALAKYDIVKQRMEAAYETLQVEIVDEYNYFYMWIMEFISI